jgi:6-phospho-beta-glucosidase
VSSYVGSNGASPVAFGPLGTAERGWLQCMWNMQRLVEEAAVTGDYGTALQAFALNPQIQAGADAKRMLDEMLVANELYLPQFADKIAELKAAGVAPTDPVVLDLMEKGL